MNSNALVLDRNEYYKISNLFLLAITDNPIIEKKPIESTLSEICLNFQ